LVLLVLVAWCGVALGQPGGFLLSLVPKDGVSNHVYPYSIDPKTGVASVLGDGDYIQTSLQNTQNSGTYNAGLKKVQFIGQSLTANGEPNPTMNFLFQIDNNGDYSSSRLLTLGGQLLTVRADDSGKVYGVEQNNPDQDARIDIVEESGLCDNIINTTAKKGYLVGHVAVNSAANQLFVSVKNDSGQISLLTADLKQAGLIQSVDQTNPGSTRVVLCYDSAPRTLLSLERPTATGDSLLLAIDPNSGHSNTIATLSGRATQGDCRGGFFFATGTKGTDAWLSVVDIAAGRIIKNVPKLSVPAPSLLVFFPQ